MDFEMRVFFYKHFLINILMLILLLCSFNQSVSKIITLNYTQKMTSYFELLLVIRKINGLDENISYDVERAILIWILGGPCEEPVPEAHQNTMTDLVQMNSIPSGSDFEMAFNYGVGLMLTESLGRKPSEHLCRFAKETLDLP